MISTSRNEGEGYIYMLAEKYIVSSGPLRGCGGRLNSLVYWEFRVV